MTSSQGCLAFLSSLERKWNIHLKVKSIVLRFISTYPLELIKSYVQRWPVVLKTLPGGIHWIRLLFITLFMLGLDSAFSFVEAMVTVARDTKRFRTTPKWKISAVFCIVSFFLSLIYATNVGLIFLDVVDYYINFVMLLGKHRTLPFLYPVFGLSVSTTYLFSSFGTMSLRTLCPLFYFTLSGVSQSILIDLIRRHK